MPHPYDLAVRSPDQFGSWDAPTRPSTGGLGWEPAILQHYLAAAAKRYLLRADSPRRPQTWAALIGWPRNRAVPVLSGDRDLNRTDLDVLLHNIPTQLLGAALHRTAQVLEQVQPPRPGIAKAGDLASGTSTDDWYTEVHPAPEHVRASLRRIAKEIANATETEPPELVRAWEDPDATEPRISGRPGWQLFVILPKGAKVHPSYGGITYGPDRGFQLILDLETDEYAFT